MIKDFSKMPNHNPYPFCPNRPQFCSDIKPPSMQPQMKLTVSLNLRVMLSLYASYQ